MPILDVDGLSVRFETDDGVVQAVDGLSFDLEEREVLSPHLPDILARDFAALVPLVRWLNQAIGYPSRARRF